MADVLIYWRDYAANWAYQLAGDRAFYWHSSAKCIAELQLGDPQDNEIVLRAVLSGCMAHF